ncbi:hypothetical protein BT63DRAFT_454269 [Microthyrium microscopicum]|uniref:Large ribosomal subunit protein bL33m n=1 Tax=Microthyrium microscopicum TaxID=703497 RepID=A0A6A6UF20_9PEZI|nr:hypothetical protein BT63DRAFT_454269 [Microthyrium microscopicum]
MPRPLSVSARQPTTSIVSSQSSSEQPENTNDKLSIGKMAKKVKSRIISVRVLSMAMTGYFKTFSRPRTSRPLSFLKYDPVVRKKVLFLEQKRGK